MRSAATHDGQRRSQPDQPHPASRQQPARGGQGAAGRSRAEQGLLFRRLKSTVTQAATDGSGIDGTGNALDNIITGNSDHNVLTGKGGDDTINGGGGIDTAAYGVAVESTRQTISPTSNATSYLDRRGGAEGTDTLSDVEIIDDARGPHVAGRRRRLCDHPGSDRRGYERRHHRRWRPAPTTRASSRRVDVTMLGANFRVTTGQDGRVAMRASSAAASSSRPAATARRSNGFEITGASVSAPALIDISVGVLVGADNVDSHQQRADWQRCRHAAVRRLQRRRGLHGSPTTLIDRLGRGHLRRRRHIRARSTTTSSCITAMASSANSTDMSNHRQQLLGFGGRPHRAAAVRGHEHRHFVHDNTFGDQARPISVYLNGAAAM